MVGKESIECANTLNNIGNVYKEQEHLDEALEYHNKALKIYEKVNGKDSI